jgi:hypothetical protein
MKKILPKSNEAAKYAENIKGWVAKGKFFGTDEKAARYYGCTHRKCQDCGAIIEKLYFRCDSCALKEKKKRYEKLDCTEWDQSLPAYSTQFGEFFENKDEVKDFLSNNKLEFDDLLLVICWPTKLSYLDSDRWYDEMPDDTDIPEELARAIEIFNETIDEIGPIGYEPAKIRVKNWE